VSATRTRKRPGRPAKGHTGRQRRRACECGFICDASATAVREHGLPRCGRGAELQITHGRDAVKVSHEYAVAFELDRQAERDAREDAEYAEHAAREDRRIERERVASERASARPSIAQTAGASSAKPPNGATTAATNPCPSVKIRTLSTAPTGRLRDDGRSTARRRRPRARGAPESARERQR
jgi:hypothetical protein